MEAAAAAAQEQDGRVLNAFYLNMICIELNSAAKKLRKKFKNQVRNKKSFFSSCRQDAETDVVTFFTPGYFFPVL